MKEEIKLVVESGGHIEFRDSNNFPVSIWKSDIRMTYWVINKEFDNLDEAVDYFITRIKK
jgi:hypothetical protein